MQLERAVGCKFDWTAPLEEVWDGYYFRYFYVSYSLFKSILRHAKLLWCCKLNAAGEGRFAHKDRQCSATLGTATSISRLIADWTKVLSKLCCDQIRNCEVCPVKWPKLNKEIQRKEAIYDLIHVALTPTPPLGGWFTPPLGVHGRGGVRKKLGGC